MQAVSATAELLVSEKNHTSCFGHLTSYCDSILCRLLHLAVKSPSPHARLTRNKTTRASMANLGFSTITSRKNCPQMFATTTDKPGLGGHIAISGCVSLLQSLTLSLSWLWSKT